MATNQVLLDTDILSEYLIKEAKVLFSLNLFKALIVKLATNVRKNSHFLAHADKYLC